MQAIIAAIISGIAWVFRSRLATWVASVMAWFGLAWATSSVVVEPSIAMLETFAAGGGGSAGEYFGVAQQWAGVLQFDRALTMIIGAVGVRYSAQAAKAFLAKRSAT